MNGYFERLHRAVCISDPKQPSSLRGCDLCSRSNLTPLLRLLRCARSDGSSGVSPQRLALAQADLEKNHKLASPVDNWRL